MTHWGLAASVCMCRPFDLGPCSLFSGVRDGRWRPRQVGKLVADGGSGLSCGGGPAANVQGQNTAASGEDAFDGLQDRGGGVVFAEVVEHRRGATDLADRVGSAFAGGVRC